MPLTKLTFDYPINSSLQIGDEIYVSYRKTTGAVGLTYEGTTSEPEHVGPVVEVDVDYIVVDKDPLNLQNFSNNRPISISSVMYKTMEIIIDNKMK